MTVEGERKETPLTLDQFAELLGLFIGVLVFISLLGVDTFKARKKRAHWVPGHALVLSALTIQVMNLLNAESTLLKEILDNRKPLNGEVVKNNLFMIHSSRLMLCMIVAYLLPGMARPGYEDSWGKLTALAVSMFVNIFSELFVVHRRLSDSSLSVITYYFYFWPHAKQVTEYSFIVSSMIISISLVWLILLLSCATLANKSIRDIIAQKIPIILANQGNAIAVENQVLKSWIVSRACYPESIIARSVLSTSAAVAVTVCVLISIAGWLVQGPVIYVFPGVKSWLKFITTNMEVTFILVGWAIIGWRCLTSVAYYGRWQSWNPNERWWNYFQVEDFWTRHILELQEEAASREKSTVDERVNKMIGAEGMQIPFLGTLLRCVYCLQFLVVYFCKGCWLVAELVLDNRFMQKISSKLLSTQDRTVDEAFSQYRAILENVDLLWGSPRTVFATNRNSINKAKDLMKEGTIDGSECKTLIRFLKENRKSTVCVGLRYLDPASSENQTGLKYLWKRHPGPVLEVEEYFIYATKPSLKLTAVSLINVIVRLSPGCGRDALLAYSEACELMDLVEESDPATDSLLSKAADSVFKTLQEQTAKTDLDTTSVVDMQGAAVIICDLAEEGKTKAELISHGRDSLDWKKAGAGNSLYKLCKSIDCSLTGDVMELVNELQSALADIIAGCMERLGAVLVDNSAKWAQDFHERKLLKAVYIACKNTAVMKQLGLYPNMDIDPTTTELSMV